MAMIKPDEGTSGQVSLRTNATQIINARRGRCGVKLTNVSDVDIFIGWNGSVTIQAGDLLLGVKGSWIFIPTESAIWGVCPSSAVVSYLEVL